MIYIVRDVREPVGDGRKIIGHCCNNLGVMGAGVAKALSDKWPSVKTSYLKWHRTNNHLGREFTLGKVQAVLVGDDIAVANIIGQHGVYTQDEIPPVRYSAIREGCVAIRELCKTYDATAHFPYLMGCDLAGGNWEEVEKILVEELVDHKIEVTIYDLFDKRG